MCVSMCRHQIDQSEGENVTELLQGMQVLVFKFIVVSHFDRWPNKSRETSLHN